MARGWLRYLSENKPDDRVIIDTNVPTVSTLLLQPDNWRASHVSIARNLSLKSEDDSFWSNFDRGYKFFLRGGFGRYTRFVMLNKMLGCVKSFHLFGGGYISEKWPHTGFLLGFAGALEKEYGVKLYGTGLGLTPISSPPAEYKKVAKRVLGRFHFIELRDAGSWTAVSGITNDHNCFAGLDDSFLTPVSPTENKEPSLHISCFLGGKNMQAFLESLSRKRVEIEKRFRAVKFWICAPHRDLEAFSAIKTVIPDIEPVEIEYLLGEFRFGSEDVMITTRFHPHMMAARSGVRGYFMKISGDYYNDKHESVRSLGSQFRPFSEFDELGFDLDPSTEMAQMDLERVAQKRALAARIYG